MQDLRLLEQLVTIAEKGSLSAAAEALHLSQSALSRSMQRLEEALGVSLFVHSRNRTAFNEVGRKAVDGAKLLLRGAEEYARSLRAYAEQLNALNIGATAPAPLWRLEAELHETFPSAAVSPELGESAALLEGLRQGRFRLILLHFSVSEPGLLCKPYVEDQIMLELPAAHPLSAREELTPEDLRGLPVLVYRTLGMWRERLFHLEGVHFIEQAEEDVLNDLILSADMANLSSSLFTTRTSCQRGRVTLPIVSEDTRQRFYLLARESDHSLFQRL